MDKLDELEAEALRLASELKKKDEEIIRLINEKIDHFNRWVMGETFKQWQRRLAREKKLREDYLRQMAAIKEHRKQWLFKNWPWPGKFTGFDPANY